MGRDLPSTSSPSPKNMMDRFRQWWSGEPMLPSTVFQRKPSIPGEIPLSQPARISSVSSVGPHLPIGREVLERQPRANSPPPPSVIERIIRYVPRADLLRKMLKNEVCVGLGEGWG